MQSLVECFSMPKLNNTRVTAIELIIWHTSGKWDLILTQTKQANEVYFSNKNKPKVTYLCSVT